MTNERIIEEMAKLEGIDKMANGKSYRKVKPMGHVYPAVITPEYLTDHNAVQRVIDDLGDDKLSMVWNSLYEAVNRCPPRIGSRNSKVLKATPAQKCEAVLKAYGKWED